MTILAFIYVCTHTEPDAGLPSELDVWGTPSRPASLLHSGHGQLPTLARGARAPSLWIRPQPSPDGTAEPDVQHDSCGESPTEDGWRRRTERHPAARKHAQPTSETSPIIHHFLCDHLSLSLSLFR